MEHANGLILQGIKTRIYNELKIHVGHWLEELLSLLWILQMSTNHSMGYTPFFLVYEVEAVIPLDLDFDALCVHFYEEQQAEEQHKADVDMLEEVCNTALVLSTRYQQGLRRYHDRRVREHSFVVGDLILPRATQSKKNGKLTPPWEGPFYISRVIWPGNYNISTMSGHEYDNGWNIQQLRRFYP